MLRLRQQARPACNTAEHGPHRFEVDSVLRRTVSTLLLLFLLGAAACQDALSVAGPSHTVLNFSGVEQVIVLHSDDSFDGKWVHLTSILTNRGEEAVTMRVRTCYLQPGIDLITTPEAEFMALALPGCVEEPDRITLHPGESSSPVFFAGQLRKPGRYRIRVRHALDPEHWAAIEISAS